MQVPAHEISVLFLILMLSVNGDATDDSSLDGMKYLKDHNVTVSVENLLGIISAGDVEEMKENMRGLGSSIYMLKQQAEEKLAAQGRAAVPVLKQHGLTSDKEAVRKRSAELIAQIRRDCRQERILWQAAVQVLGSVKNPAAVPRLLELLSDEDREIRAEAMKALVLINDPETAGKLADMLKTVEKEGFKRSCLGAIKAYRALAKDEELSRMAPLLGKDSFESDLVILETLTERAPAEDWAGAVVKAARGERALLLEGGSGAPVAFARQTLRKLYGIKAGKKISWSEMLKKPPTAYRNMPGEQLKALRKNFLKELRGWRTGARYFPILSSLKSSDISCVAGVDAKALHNSSLGTALAKFVNSDEHLKAMRENMLALTGNYRIDRVVAMTSRDYSGEKGYAGLILEGFFDSAGQIETLADVYGEKDSEFYMGVRIFTARGKPSAGLSICVVNDGCMAIFMGGDSKKGARMVVDALVSKVRRQKNVGEMLHPAGMSGIAWSFMNAPPEAAKVLKDASILSALSDIENLHLKLLAADGKLRAETAATCSKGRGKDALKKFEALFKDMAAKIELRVNGDLLGGRIEFAPEALEGIITGAAKAFTQPRLVWGRFFSLKIRATRIEKRITVITKEAGGQRDDVAELEFLITRLKGSPARGKLVKNLERDLKNKKAALAKNEKRLEELEKDKERIEKELSDLEKHAE